MTAPLPTEETWRAYAVPFEARMRAIGARPHWAKWTSEAVDHDYLAGKAGMGAAMAAFRGACRRMDPRRAMRSPHLDSLLGYNRDGAASEE
jgi:hypothetical protein